MKPSLRVLMMVKLYHFMILQECVNVELRRAEKWTEERWGGALKKDQQSPNYFGADLGTQGQHSSKLSMMI